MRTYPIDAIEEAYDGDDLRGDGYSGRGMYGKTCAALGFDSIPDAFVFFALLGEYTAAGDAAGMDDDASAQLFDLVKAAYTDGMGTGIVVYFPGWVFA